MPRLDKISDIRDAIASVLEAVADGLVSVDEGAQLTKMLSDYAAPVIESADLVSRIMNLEADRR
jgi:hypothetical protein